MLTGTAVLSFVVLCARTKAGVEDWSLDVVVRVGVDAVAGLQGRRELKRPWAPALHERGGDRLVEG